jgi:hypothetical protein
VSERDAKRWLAGLEVPDPIMRLDTASRFLPEKVGAQGVRRTVRALNPAPKVKQPCFVCGRHRTISQWHHLIEVGLVAKVLRRMAIYDWAPSIPAVSLCVNHHSYWHMLNRRRRPLMDEIHQELSEGEWNRIVGVAERRDVARDSVWQEVRREFLDREEAYRQSKPREDDERGER